MVFNSNFMGPANYVDVGFAAADLRCLHVPRAGGALSGAKVRRVQRRSATSPFLTGPQSPTGAPDVRNVVSRFRPRARAAPRYSGVPVDANPERQIEAGGFRRESVRDTVSIVRLR